MYCPNCKEEFPGKFCPECGTKLVDTPKQNDFGVNISDDAAIMGGVNVTRNESHNSTSYDQRVINNSSVTNNIVERAKSNAELHQERTNRFLELCKQAFSDGLLDEEEKIMLATERLRLGLSEEEANRLIEMARRASVSRMNTLSMRDSMTLKTIDRYIDANNAAILKGQVPRLAALARNYKIDEVLYRYYMLMAALCPDELIREYERNVADDYWQTYWVAIAYMKKNDTLNAEDAIVKLDVYTEYPEDNSLLLSALSTYRVFGAADATEFIGAILPDRCYPLLIPFIQALFFEITPERAAEVGAQKETCQFYLDNIVNLESPEKKAAAQKAAEAEDARKAAEEKASYDVILKSAGDQKLRVITIVKLSCGVGLREAKALVEAAPCTLVEGLAKLDAEDIKKTIEEYGAKIELRESLVDVKCCIVEEATVKDPDEAYKIGNYYFNGSDGRIKSYREAVKWYIKAAELGHADAQFKSGDHYYRGSGVEKDESEAVKWYSKAAEQGHAEAQYNLAICYFAGYGVEKDESEAVKWYRKAAEQGHANAQVYLAASYEGGRGVEEDKVEAVKWYLKAVAQGNEDAQAALFYRFKNASGINKYASEAVKWYHRAAEQGDVSAQVILGLCYDGGYGVEQNLFEAIKWWRKAAEQGDAIAQRVIGYSYESGYGGVEKNPFEAVKWYSKAAEQGNANAQYHLGTFYDGGYFGIVENDKSEAVKWYRKAAEQGDERAKKKLKELGY